jgi:hypothetical protein
MLHETHPRDEDKEKLTMRVTRSENEFIPDEADDPRLVEQVNFLTSYSFIPDDNNDPRLIEFVFIHIHMCVRVVCTHGGTSAATKTDIPS